MELPDTQRVRVEHVLARLSLIERRGPSIMAADALLRSWERTVEGTTSTVRDRWAAAIGDRSVLHDYGQAAVAHNSADFLAWFTPLLAALDHKFRNTTEASDTLSLSWQGLDPARWWYRQIPADPELAALYRQPATGIDISSLATRFSPPDDPRAKENTRLSGTNLSGADLRGANLIAMDLRGVDLTSADLRGATLAGAQLDSISLKSAHLSGADLRFAQAHNADFTNASLVGAQLDGASLTGSTLINADFENASLRWTSLADTDATGARLVNADLRKCFVHDADLSGVDATGASVASKRLRSMLRID